MKIAVLMGGISGERSVSLASGMQVVLALREAGHEAVGVDTSRGVLSADEEAEILEGGIGDPPRAGRSEDVFLTGDLSPLIADSRFGEADLIFLTLHGGGGEDGTIQTVLELSGLPYVGSGPVGCALAMDKDLSKRLFRDAGVRTLPWISVVGRLEAEACLKEIVDRLGLPLIVKPPSGGSTLGLTLARSEEELDEGIALSLEFEERILFEGYARGREVTVGILGEEALPVGEIIPEHEIFDYECKYREGMAEEIFPAPLDPETSSRIQGAALVAHRCLRLRDFSRVDFILDEDGTPWCLEANALPGLTANSLLPRAGRAAGISFPELCHRVAEMGSRRRRNPAPGMGV